MKDLSKADLLRRRRDQIEDAAAVLQSDENRSFVRVALMSSDGQTTGLKFRDVRGSDMYLVNLWHALQAVFRYEADKLGYLPSGPEARGYQPDGVSACMISEDIGKKRPFPEGVTEFMFCSPCADKRMASDVPVDIKAITMVVDAERICYCPVCGHEPFQLAIESWAGYAEKANAWEPGAKKEEDADA